MNYSEDEIKFVKLKEEKDDKQIELSNKKEL